MTLEDEQLLIQEKRPIFRGFGILVTIVTILAVVLLTIFLCLSNSAARNKYPYDYYVFAQQWPSALCKEINATLHGKCTHVPKEVNTWVVHGLWPSKAHTHHYGPFNCNSSWPFNPNKLTPIQQRLNSYWPNLMENKADTSFWLHEWDKHGTCACQQDSKTFCHSEIDYFNKAMDIRDELNFDKKLTQNGIKPSLNDAYDFDQIENVLGSGRYQCYETKRSKNQTNLPANFQVLAQIMTCFDKKFNRGKCEDYEKPINGPFDSGPYDSRPCKRDEKVLILPIHMVMGNEV